MKHTGITESQKTISFKNRSCYISSVINQEGSSVKSVAERKGQRHRGTKEKMSEPLMTMMKMINNEND